MAAATDDETAVKFRTNQVDAFLRKPDPTVVAVLLYGPDDGLVRERARFLAQTVVEDLADPFRVAEFTAATLKEDPPRLNDETAALALTGGRRVVRVREAGDEVAALFKPFLADIPGEALVIIEAANLGPRSRLRRLFEDADNAAALPCYPDEGDALAGLIQATLGRDKITIEPDALAFLVTNLGSDRIVTRGEIEKLALYAGDGGRVTLEDAVMCVGDSALMSLQDIASAVADGNQVMLERALGRAYSENLAPIAILRAVARHFQRLHLTAGRIAAGTSPDRAIAALRPPVFFKVKSQFVSELKHWPLSRLGAALNLLTEAEITCKTTGMPAEVICARALMSATSAAGRPR
jgi:DNA polymerase-3 subunit delta